MSAGKCEWLIPDAFYPVKDNGDYVSHEAVCILNKGKEDAQIKFTLYFEDRPPVHGFSAICPVRAWGFYPKSPNCATRKRRRFPNCPAFNGPFWRTPADT